MKLHTRVLGVALTGTLAGTAFAATPAVAASPAPATGGVTAATTYRDLNVPGLPISVAAPSNWPAFSPKALAQSHTKRYPKAVVNLARTLKQTPAQFVKKNAYINLMSYGGIGTRHYASVTVLDAGKANWTYDGVRGTLKRQKATVTSTSTVRTKFGTVYRVHYRQKNTAGYRYYGVMSMVHLKDRAGRPHVVLVDNTSSSAGDSLAMSNRTLASADWR